VNKYFYEKFHSYKFLSKPTVRPKVSFNRKKKLKNKKKICLVAPCGTTLEGVFRFNFRSKESFFGRKNSIVQLKKVSIAIFTT
jgi:hypothetical protein